MGGYKLLVCDIDGTLVDDSKRIPDLNRRMIARFRREGGLFTLATGRIEKSVERYVRELGIDAPLILYNGAKIYHPLRKEVLLERHLEKDDLLRILELRKSYPFDHVFYSRGEGYILERTDAVKAYERGDGFSCILVDSVDCLLDKTITKVLMIGDGTVFPAYRKDFNTLFGDRANLIQSENHFLELLPPGMNKGTALADLIKILEVDREEVICFGDNLNDTEMLAFAGMGVAMGNAREELKLSADRVAPDNNEAGVGKFLQSIMEAQHQ